MRKRRNTLSLASGFKHTYRVPMPQSRCTKSVGLEIGRPYRTRGEWRGRTGRRGIVTSELRWDRQFPPHSMTTSIAVANAIHNREQNSFSSIERLIRDNVSHVKRSTPLMVHWRSSSGAAVVPLRMGSVIWFANSINRTITNSCYELD